MKQFNIRLTNDEYEQLNQIAKSEKRNATSLIRMIIHSIYWEGEFKIRQPIGKEEDK